MHKYITHINFPQHLMHFELFVLDWLAIKKMNTNFKDYTKEEFSNSLCQFYPSARQKPKIK